MSTGLLQRKPKGYDEQADQHAGEGVAVHGHDHSGCTYCRKQQTIDDAFLIPPFSDQVLSAENTIGKQEQRPDVIGQIKGKVNQLTLELIEVEVVLTERDEYGVSGGNKSPEKKYSD